MIPSGNVVSVVSCCSSVPLAYIFASESIKFEQPSIGLGFRLRVLLCGSVTRRERWRRLRKLFVV